MGIVKTIKKAFGFVDDDVDDDDMTVISESANEVSSCTTSPSLSAGEDSGEVESDPVIPVDTIFKSVVDEFNKAMPSFLSTGANAEAQRQHLYNVLDADVKSFLQSLNVNALERCNHRWEQERNRLNNEVDTMKGHIKKLEETEAEKSKQLLSAERQKRAIQERVRDLEAQIASVEAEKDQYALETRSLVNKLRVSNLLKEGAEVPDITAFESHIEELNKQLEEQKNSYEASIEQIAGEKTELQSRYSALEATNRDLSEQLNALKIKTDMTDVMLNDLNQRASSASKEVQQRDGEIATLKESLNDAINKAATIQSQLDEAHANLEIAATIQEEVERIQESMAKKNQKIAELNVEIRRRDDRINALEAEELSLRKTIETNLLNQAQSEKTLREDMERLEQQLASAPTRDKSRNKRRQAPKISAIDEDLDNTDWLVATPPEGTSARTSGVPDNEFGYQEPSRKNPPENSAQMSLW
ncbi:MAG: hypothetical protein NC082_00620 [Clostridiales bacterium]|nr:hypothetical protein [Clostridiales bacterium]